MINLPVDAKSPSSSEHWMLTGCEPYLHLVSVSFMDNFGYLNNKGSEQLSMLSGVPQISVLGPILFLHFVNDVILKSVSKANLFLFADDIFLSLANASCQLEISEFTETCTISQWLTTNNLGVNVEKTKFVKFSLRNKSRMDMVQILLGDFEVRQHLSLSSWTSLLTLILISTSMFIHF